MDRGTVRRLIGLRSILAVKLFLGCAGLAVVVSLTGNSLLFKGASDCAFQAQRDSLSQIAATAVVQIDPNLHSRIHSRADESTDGYRRLRASLVAVRKANPGIRNVYTMRKQPNGGWTFVVDSEENPKDMSHPGDPYDATECPRMDDGLEAPTADDKPTPDAWGIWLSGYAPIKDSNGRVDGMLGLDMSLAQLQTDGSLLRRRAILSTLVAIVLSLASALILTRKVLHPLKLFTAATESVRNGDLEVRVPDWNTRELEKFGSAFNLMVAGLKESRDRLVELSTREHLTGLVNHMHFHERLSVEMERAERYKHSVSLIIADLDRFKSINDTLGHQIGDSLLRQLASLMTKETRSIDIAARYGGDEFAIILPEVDSDGAMAFAERLRKTVESHDFYAVPSQEMLAEGFVPDGASVARITVTIGVASYPRDHSTRDGLIMAADIALCRAKHVARNSVCAYEQGADGTDSIDPQDLYDMLRNPDNAAVKSLAAAVDAKDRYTGGHSERVTHFALDLAQTLGADADQLDALKIAGLLHDLGKIGVPDAVLNKPGSLTQEERKVMQQHPALGGSIIGRAPQLDVIVPAVLFHHERWDGAGYPDGLSGEAIPLMARILAVADAFDAMTSDRPYRKAMPVESALIELRASSGKQFDPKIVDVFIAMVKMDMNKAA